MKSLKNILKFVVPYWKYALLNIFSNLLSVLFSLVSFTFFLPILNMLFSTNLATESAPKWDLFNFETIKANLYYYTGQMIKTLGPIDTLFYISLLILGLYFLKNFFRYMGMYFIAPIRNGVVRDLRNALYNKVLILPLAYFSEQRKGDIISRMSSDVLEVEWSILSSLESLFREPISIISFVLALFFLSPSLTLFVLILLPLSAILIGFIGRSLKKSSEKGQKKLGHLLSIIEETLGGLRIIKAFTAIEASNKKFKENNQVYTRLMINIYRKRDLASPLSEFMGVAVVVSILYFGGRLILGENASIDAATFLVYIAIFSQILPPAKAVTSAFYNVQKGAASVDRIEAILNAEEKIIEKENALSKKEFQNEIKFQNLSFEYIDNTPVLKNINLKVRKGQAIALVGASGGGKSTLVDLLPRFYDPQKGKITIDGIDIRDLVINDLRSLLGIVTQESILFNDTVFNNIALGVEDKVSHEEVVAAAKIANAHEFIMQMEKGYQSTIGDRGQKLSGGQRQRLSIARAVLKNPPILILDEATSALDTESERLVQNALENLMKNRTSLVIAHRLSTIKNADEIVVIEKGEIVERGTHQQLIEKKQIYSKLHALQNFD
ncbi:MAG TPA: antibiotic ABC transporter ATP-binding protein [Bacteroidales bacterium]|nr:antibiotic ABC transporter ATP-binding protein [Bacteroidales bacterium]